MKESREKEAEAASSSRNIDHIYIIYLCVYNYITML